MTWPRLFRHQTHQDHLHLDLNLAIATTLGLKYFVILGALVGQYLIAEVSEGASVSIFKLQMQSFTMLWFSHVIKSVNTHLRIISSVRYICNQEVCNPTSLEGRATPN